MASRIFKILTILAVTALAAGCKLVIVSPSGGDVTSGSSGTCAGGSVCEVVITNPAFTDSFTAVPKPGYQFVRWQGGGSDFKCGDSKNATCTITFAGDAIATAAIATYEIINIMPIYKDVGVNTDGDTLVDRVDPDDDNDGVNDELDNCKLVGPNLDGFGCPVVPDTDGDGVYDDADICPLTTVGSSVFPNGCVLDITSDVDQDGTPDVNDLVVCNYEAYEAGLCSITARMADFTLAEPYDRYPADDTAGYNWRDQEICRQLWNSFGEPFCPRSPLRY